MKLPVHECPPFFQFYAEYVEEDVLKELTTQLDDYVQFIRSVPKEKYLFRYQDKKWTIKEIVGHNTETERLKSTAALRIARNDTTPIPGFNEDEYVAATHFNDRSMEDLLEEFIAVRKSSILLFRSLNTEELMRIGTASQQQISSRALFYFLVGHIKHHVKIIEERYL